jgi:RHS repeat-associated protein
VKSLFNSKFKIHHSKFSTHVPDKTHKTPTKHKMKYRYLFALAASVTGTAFGGMPAPLPEFKTAKQLAAWRAEKAAEPAAKATDEAPAFYTGKPYVDSSGGYAFKYRSYNPELARWTSEDPSGFPDGANNLIYAKNCALSALDPLGFATQWITGSYTMTAKWAEIKTTSTGTTFSLSGFPLSVQISVTTCNSWDKFGQVSTTKTAGEFAQDATAPSGWSWVDSPNSTINPTSTTQDGSATYGSEYQSQIGTSSVTVLGYTTTTPIYGTLHDGSWKVTYDWKRLAQE